MSDLQKFSAEGETGAARVREIRKEWETSRGFTGGPDKRKRDGVFRLWCHDCARYDDEGHDEDCSWLMVRDLLDRLVRASQEPSGWQPIETCPRDGRDVFIFDDSMPRWPAVNVARYQGFPDGSAGFISKCTVWPRDASMVMLKPRLWHPMIQIPPVPSVPLLRSLERLHEHDDDDARQSSPCPSTATGSPRSPRHERLPTTKGQKQ